MSIKIKELPEQERPYEKMELYGEKVLSNAELLAIIIKTGTKNKSSVEMAQEILKLDNQKEDTGLEFLMDISMEELMKIDGIGKIKAIQIKAVCELTKRMNMPANYRKIKIQKASDIAKVVMPTLKNEKQEIIKLIILDMKNQILKIIDVVKGEVGFASASISTILSEPIKMKAPKIILVHNHPTGDPTPSLADIQFTRKLCEATTLLGIELLDHIVIGNMNYKSIFNDILFKE